LFGGRGGGGQVIRMKGLGKVTQNEKNKFGVPIRERKEKKAKGGSKKNAQKSKICLFLGFVTPFKSDLTRGKKEG